MNLSELQRKAKERGYGNIVKILAEAVILRQGWEMDNECWLVKMKGGSVQLFTTNHGGLYPMQIDDLKDYIKETQESLDSLKNIQELLK
jgi:hypothetical protein